MARTKLACKNMGRASDNTSRSGIDDLQASTSTAANTEATGQGDVAGRMPASSVGDNVVVAGAASMTTVKAWSPADCPSFGVKGHKPQSRNPYSKELHLDTDVHLSSACDIKSVRGCGEQQTLRCWWKELSSSCKEKVNAAGFGGIVQMATSKGQRDRRLLVALATRWWDTTHTFHFDTVGELTMTPLDFAAITGIRFSGHPVKYEKDAHKDKRRLTRLFGQQFARAADKKMVCEDLYTKYGRFETGTPELEDRMVRLFILHLLGATLLNDKSKFVWLWYVPSLETVEDIGLYNWGAPSLSCLYRNMDAISRKKNRTMGGFWRAWEIWACEYLMPVSLRDPKPKDTWPRGLRWLATPGVRANSHDTAGLIESLANLTADQVEWHPWGSNASDLPSYVAASIPVSRLRILLEGPAGFAWYLGERVSVQSLGTPAPCVPISPPPTMLDDVRLTVEEKVEGLIGKDAKDLLHPDSPDYNTFRREYLVYKHTSRPSRDEGDGVMPSTQPRAAEGVSSHIPMPSRSITVPGVGEEGDCEELVIPRGKHTACLPLPSDCKSVSAETVAELLDMHAGVTSLLFAKCHSLSKACRELATARRKIVELETSKGISDRLVHTLHSQIRGLEAKVQGSRTDVGTSTLAQADDDDERDDEAASGEEEEHEEADEEDEDDEEEAAATEEEEDEDGEDDHEEESDEEAGEDDHEDAQEQSPPIPTCPAASTVSKKRKERTVPHVRAAVRRSNRIKGR